MKGYIKYFKTMLITGLQYKTAALAGMCTQFFWGILQVFIYQAFYAGSGQSVPMNFSNLVTYVWLQQSLLGITYIRYNDHELTESIKNGTVAYELVRPYNIYTWWYIKCIAKKLATAALRCVPIILFASLLPEPYGLSLPVSFGAFLMFLLNLFLGLIIVAGILVIVHTITFFTYDDKGISNIIFIIGELFAGFTLPIPLLPKAIQTLSYFLPFRFIGDLSFRIYSGDIPLSTCGTNLLFQIFWIVVLVVIGRLLMKKAAKKVYVQGG